jgi:PadR family transcriptional regulator, regulatory protein PadR
MLGRFEEAILLVLTGAKGEATTAEIYEVLSGKPKKVSFGAIYTTLDRMEDKNFVTRRKGEPLAHRGGKARYYYKITSDGRAAVIESQKLTAEWSYLPETTTPAR